MKEHYGKFVPIAGISGIPNEGGDPEYGDTVYFPGDYELIDQQNYEQKLE